MDIAALQRKVVASDIAPEQLAGNTSLSKEQKIAEASRQFEAVLLRQILENTQKTVIHSKYATESMSSAIYRDQITSQLADSISKSGGFGLAKSFQQQLTRPTDIAPEKTATKQTASESSAAHAAVATTTAKQQHLSRYISGHPAVPSAKHIP
jgi:Rod binding domain-containing protein